MHYTMRVRIVPQEELQISRSPERAMNAMQCQIRVPTLYDALHIPATAESHRESERERQSQKCATRIKGE